MTPAKEGLALIRLILVGTLLLLALSFVLQNQEQEVTLRYFSASPRVHPDLQTDPGGVRGRPPGIGHPALPGLGTRTHRAPAKTKALQEAEVISNASARPSIKPLAEGEFVGSSSEGEPADG